MGLAIARDNDACGGLIIATATNTTVNGRLVARHGDHVTSHGAGLHANATLIATSTSVIMEGKFVCRLLDFATCGHQITTASPDSYAG